MQITTHQLATHLKKSLAPVYLISGDVPLLVQEAAEQIRLAAQQQGFTDRIVKQIDQQFNWQEFLADANNLSLFSSKEIWELRLTGATPSTAGIACIQEYCKRPCTDKLIVITGSKLDSKQQKSNWVQVIQTSGVFIPIWPMEFAEFNAWLKQRVQRAGLTVSNEVIQLLANYTEGNLLAAQQEIEKLRLLFADNQNISMSELQQAITDNARFDVFHLSDATLQGNASRITHILHNLKQEGVEPVLILWALTKEIRLLINLMQLSEQNIPLAKALQMHYVWEKRKSLVIQALKRQSLVSLKNLLQHAARIDCIIKGMQHGNSWDELLKLCLGLSGIQLFSQTIP